MNDYEIGAALRERLERDQQRGGTPDGRRLQALVGDLCGDDPRLLPAMRYMVSWEPFLREASRRPPLADPRLAPRLRQELREIFAMPVCERMDTVLRGMLDLPEPAVPAAAPAARPRAVSSPQRARASEPAGEERGGSLAGVVGLCLAGFVAGGLLALLVGSVLPPAPEPGQPLPQADMPEAVLRPGSAAVARVTVTGRGLV